MLKLINKASVATALAAAIALGSSPAFATLTFTLTGAGGSTSLASATPGTVINLTLSAVITGTAPGGYDFGGSFVSTGQGNTGGTGGWAAPVLNNGSGTPASFATGTAFNAVGSQVGSVYNANDTIWGGGIGATDQFNSTGFFYARSNPVLANTGAPAPVLGSTLVLGTISYTVGTSDASTFTLQFVPRNRPSVTDQLWQQNGAADIHDDNSDPVSSSAVFTVNIGSSVALWVGTSGVDLDTNTAGNWLPATTPNGTSAAVEFGQTSAPTAVTNNTAHTYNHITFDGNGAYTISGSAAITLDGTTPKISVVSGSQVITAPLTLTSAGLTKDGAGKVSVNSIVTSGALNVNAGILALNSHTNVAGNATAGASKVSSLSFGGGTLDLSNGSMVIGGTSVAAVKAEITAGTIFTSNTALNTGIGYAAGNDPNLGDLAAGTALNPAGTLRGQSFSATDTLIRYTYMGDANLDGATDFSDLGFLLANYHKPGSFTWTQGNFNGTTGDVTAANPSGFDVDFSDLGLLLATYQSPAALTGTHPIFVPEPASLAILGLGAAALLSRKKRR